MDSKACIQCNIEKHIEDFYKKNAKNIIANVDWSVTMRKKIKHQFNGRNIMIKKERLLEKQNDRYKQFK